MVVFGGSEDLLSKGCLIHVCLKYLFPSKKKCVFVDWYESTGELLSEGAFGHVTTYCHNRTRTEFAVKVILLAAVLSF